MLTSGADASPSGLDDHGAEEVDARANSIPTVDVARGIARDQLELNIIVRRVIFHARGLALRDRAVARIFRINPRVMIQRFDQSAGTGPTLGGRKTPRRSLPKIVCSHWGASDGGAGGPALEGKRLAMDFGAGVAVPLSSLCRIYWPTRPIPSDPERI